MENVLLPSEEEARLAALRSYGILDTEADELFDDIARLSGSLCEAPMVMISLVDRDRQWFKSRIGVEPASTPRDISFCKHAIMQNEVFIVPDAREDPRFSSSPLVTGEMGVRFYAGAPLITPTGHAIGTLCIMDTAPRFLPDSQENILRTLSQQVIAQLELRRNRSALVQTESQLILKNLECNQAENKIVAQKDFLVSVLGSAAEGIYTLDNDGRVNFINAAAQQILGWSDTQLIGRHIHDIIHYQQLDGTPLKREECVLEQVLQTQVALKGREESFVRHDGTMFPVLCSAAPILIDGNVAGMVLAFTDDTDRKIAEQENKERERKLQTLANNVGALLGRIDTSERYLYCNDLYEKTFGLTSDEIIGRTLLEVHGLSIYETIRDTVLRALSGLNVTCHANFANEVLGPRNVQISYTPEFGIDGEVTSIVMVAVDCTERIQYQSQLAQAQKLESIGQLAAGIAHELNTPIQYIGHNARFLLDGFKDLKKLLEAYGDFVTSLRTSGTSNAEISKLDNVVQEIDLEYLLAEIPAAISQSLEGTEQVATIVSAMKEFSHPGSKEAAPVDLNSILESTAVVSKNNWKNYAKLVLDLDKDLPHVPCLPGEINQVFLNIFVNAGQAFEAMEQSDVENGGTIKVGTRKITIHEQEYAEVRISDSAGGIDAKVLPRIFDPFFTTKGVGKGTGQGLAISHLIVVKKHGGTIECESELGRGTTFIIRLPLKRPDDL